MCCFSKPVPHVSGTKIFARALEDDRQALVYSMQFAAAEELAMILPIPVPPGPAEDAVRFVSLEDYDAFFDDLGSAFVTVMPQTLSRGGPVSRAAAAPILKVHEVGDFEASFVPTLADFDRLDERFKLAPEVWARLPQYTDWGFAVFKLAAQEAGLIGRVIGRAKRQKVHPMAFTFPRRDPESLFFPTVHIHDGEVHETARFDHTLYCQSEHAAGAGWQQSERPLGGPMKVSRAQGLIDPDAHAHRRILVGELPNQDQRLG